MFLIVISSFQFIIFEVFFSFSILLSVYFKSIIG